MKTFKSVRNTLEEKTLTPAEKKKREEVAKAIERDNPNMPMGMKMAIATKTAKRVAEETRYYSLVHKATNKVLSTHKDLDSAKDEHRGMDQGERAHYRIATSTKEPKTWNMKEELEELNQMSLARYQSKAKSVGMQGGTKSAKHLAGAKRAGEKLKYGDYSEEVEQVDELNKDTVKNYMNKSINDFGHQNFMSRVGIVADKEKAAKKAKNRSFGILRANKRIKEDVEQLDEMSSTDRFKDYHHETAKLMKGIHSALSNHYSLHNKDAHWGHVGDIRHIHDQLRDIHDRLHEQGEYAKKAKERSDKINAAVREEVEQLDEYYTVHPHEDGKPKTIGSPTKFHGSAISKALEHTKAGRTVTVNYKDHKGVVDSVTIKPGDHVKKALDNIKTERTNEEVELDEAGPFLSTTGKPPRKGSVADLAAKKRKEQEKGKQPIEPKNQMIGTARIVKEDQDQHYCAKHVYSNVYGEGIVLEGQHSDPDSEGNIEWYIVDFKDGPKKVFTEKLEIMVAEYHNNHKKKRMTDGR